jgi:Tfp pilus assembly protein PilF
MNVRKAKSPMNFKTIAQLDVPQGRSGKHKQIINRILSDLDQVAESVALKIRLAELAKSKEKVRSALNRAIHNSGRSVAAASDTDFLYVWNEGE